MNATVAGGGLLTVREAAEALRVSRQAVRVWCEKGYLRGRKIGSLWRIDAESVRRLLAGLSDGEVKE